jgi:Flp pilus assembly pilin Flp
LAASVKTASIGEMLSDERGQDLIEYALLVAVVAVTCGAALLPVAPSISAICSKIVSLAAKSQ